ncbi:MULTISPECIES: TRAP transporter large permease [Sulfitobacter]|uniref:C4-dicarboxylate TRAP transporter large permease protein DctM n=1 Tax=Sulfitobacter dubius TaxID=218673 RepID=A0ABY3ZNY1_9RHOB|nr:TRAP transporter large permease subunit [Sulfitobacter dubius]UOA15819.1 C4-dicarboxylate TRAP transporter large permease protein DctM [Sulfitobacter dubius]WOI28791.1 TRAP transporter large permease subunit [Sulfitobacter dubius]
MSGLIAHLDLLMFPVAIVLLLRGFPVAFTLAGVGLLFSVLGAVFQVGFFAGGDLSFLRALFGRIFGLMDETNEVLVAVPLFVFMGVTLERSGVAADLLSSMAKIFGRLPGGLGISVAIVGMLLAASTGIVGATVVTMGLISLPTMLKANYDKRLSTGIIAASGTLGQIIPPSLVLIILGDVLSNAYITARRNAGDWAPDPVSVGDIFAGALLPGLILVGAYVLYILCVALFAPHRAPSVVAEGEKVSLGPVLLLLAPPLLLIVAVLGSILFGVATPTEAASIGSIGAILLAGQRLSDRSSLPQLVAVIGAIIVVYFVLNFDLRLAKSTITSGDKINIAIVSLGLIAFTWGSAVSLWRIWLSKTADEPSVLTSILRASLHMSVMVFAIYIGAQVFNLAFRGLGGEETVNEFFTGLPGGPWIALGSMLLIMFLLGFFLDFLEIVFVVTPIMAPVLFSFSGADGSVLFHPVWIAVVMGLNLQTSFLTPPFGFALFYLRAVAPKEVTTGDIYRGIIPFVVIQIVILAVVLWWSDLATWLPALLTS